MLDDGEPGLLAGCMVKAFVMAMHHVRNFLHYLCHDISDDEHSDGDFLPEAPTC